MVVTMAEPFALASESPDLYRNFVIAVPLPRRRFVRGVELRPGNPRIVHHAFLYVDPTPQSRRLSMRQDQPGFPDYQFE